jgi:hypothetical protein
VKRKTYLELNFIRNVFIIIIVRSVTILQCVEGFPSPRSYTILSDKNTEVYNATYKLIINFKNIL